MANTLTGMIPTLYEAMQVVSREMVGFIPAVTLDSSANAAALNQVVRVPLSEAGALEDITPGATPASSGDTTVSYVDVAITKSKAAPIRWTGEEQLAVGSTGVYNQILANQFADGMRKLVNAVEVDLAAAAKVNASRAYGTAGTTPFGTAGNLTDFAGIAKILDDNGAPLSERQIVLNSAAIANLRGVQSVLFKVNEAGSSDMLRDGMTGRLQNMAVRYSGGISLHTKGTATGALINNASGEAVGETTLTLDTITAGATGILAGDVVTFAADTANKYVVNTGLNAASGNIVIGKPGALILLPDNNAMTIGNNYTGNYAFTRSAIVLASRAPAMPKGGDDADDVMTITDPVSGLTFQVAMYRQYRQVKIEIGLAWGVGAPNGAHIATLLG